MNRVPKPQEVLWARIGIAILVAFIFFTIFSSYYIINRRVKVSPAPTPAHGEQPAKVELQQP
jgi:hypothetical protein